MSGRAGTYLGADKVIDYARDDGAAGGSRYDVIFGAVNVLPFRRWRRALRSGGTIVTVNPALDNAAARWLSRAVGGARLEGVLVRPSGADLETIGAWVAAGKVRPMVDRTYPLSDAVRAHHYSETRRACGKLVLVVDEELAEKSASDPR